MCLTSLTNRNLLLDWLAQGKCTIAQHAKNEFYIKIVKIFQNFLRSSVLKLLNQGSKRFSLVRNYSFIFDFGSELRDDSSNCVCSEL